MLSASSNTAVPVAPYGRFQQIPFWRLRALFRERGLYDEDVAALMACYDPHTGGYFVRDAVTNCVVAAGPYTLEDARENWPGIQIESTETDAE